MSTAFTRARASGSSVAVEAGNRRMRTAFGHARVGLTLAGDVRPPVARHIMIARHAQPKGKRRAARA